MKTSSVVLYVVALVAIIVAVDLLFLRDHPWARLAVNVGIVAVWATVYLTVLKKR